MTTPGEDFAAILHGQHAPEPAPITDADIDRDDQGQLLLRRHRPPKPDRSQGSGAHGKAAVDPGAMFGEAIINALSNPLAGRL